MADVYAIPCQCGMHDFVFGSKPDRDVEVKCPECGQLWMIKGEKAKKEAQEVAKPLEPKATGATAKKESGN